MVEDFRFENPSRSGAGLHLLINNGKQEILVPHSARLHEMDNRNPNIPIYHDLEKDEFCWKGTNSHEFVVKAAYNASIMASPLCWNELFWL